MKLRPALVLAACALLASCAAGPAEEQEVVEIPGAPELAGVGLHRLHLPTAADEPERVGKARVVPGALLVGGRLIADGNDYGVVASLDERAVPALAALDDAEPTWLVFVANHRTYERFEARTLLERISSANGSPVEVEFASGLVAFEAGQVLDVLAP
ncbi:MAG: hypothetical protein AAGB93_03625 [Planctomycetota bacterium]